MANAFNLCLSVKLLISPSNLNEGLAGSSILGCRFFSHHCNISFYIYRVIYHFIRLSLLTCRVSVEKSAYNLMGVPLYVICHFSLVAFNILSLSLTFVSLITMCVSQCVPP